MLALGVTTSSNILTWQHCSSDFREILNAHGVTDEYYMFQYDLGQGSLDGAFQSHPIRLCPKEFLGGQECQDPCVLADCAECQGPNECQGDSECPETALPHRSLDCLQEVDVELNQELRAFPLGFRSLCRARSVISQEQAHWRRTRLMVGAQFGGGSWTCRP